MLCYTNDDLSARGLSAASTAKRATSTLSVLNLRCFLESSSKTTPFSSASPDGHAERFKTRPTTAPQSERSLRSQVDAPDFLQHQTEASRPYTVLGAEYEKRPNTAPALGSGQQTGERGGTKEQICRQDKTLQERAPAFAKWRPNTTHGARRCEATIHDMLPKQKFSLRDFEWKQDNWKEEVGRLSAKQKAQQKAERAAERAIEEEYIRHQELLLIKKTAATVKAVQEALRATAHELTAALKEIDVNGDGEISQREFGSAVNGLEGFTASQAEVSVLYRHLLTLRNSTDGRKTGTNTKPATRLTVDELLRLLFVDDASFHSHTMSKPATHYISSPAPPSPPAASHGHVVLQASKQDTALAEATSKIEKTTTPRTKAIEAKAKSTPCAIVKAEKCDWTWKVELRKKHMARSEGKDVPPTR